MEELLYYNIKSGLILLILTLFYNLLFAKDKLFVFNRFLLLFIIGFSFIVPLLHFEATKMLPINNQEIDNNMVSSIVITPSNEKGFTLPSIPVMIYMSMFLVSLILFIKRMFSLKQKLSSLDFIRKDNYLIAYDSKSENSFSFFNRIVIGTKNFDDKDIEVIENHEKIHINQKHSIDIILLEMLKIVQWFNPAVYLLKRNIVTNHEYIADKIILEEKPQNEYLQLLTKNITTLKLNLTNSFFNRSILRRRIEMFDKKHNPILSIMKYMIFAPLMLFIFIFVSCSDESKEFENAVEYKDIDFGSEYDENNTGPSFNGNLQDYVYNNLEYPESAKENDVLAKIHYNLLIDEEGKVIDYEYLDSKFLDVTDKVRYQMQFKKNAEKLIENMPDWEPAKKDGKAVKFKQFFGVIFGNPERWENMNPPSMTVSTKDGYISTEREEAYGKKGYNTVEKDGIKHLYHNKLMTKLVENIKYPKQAHDDNIESKVILEIKLNKEGTIETIETVDVKLNKDGKEIDQEDTYGFADAAKKAVMDIGNLPPAENEEGKPVNIKFSLPVTFRLQ